MRKTLSIFTLLPLLIFQFSAAFGQSDAKRSVTKLADDVYRLQNNFHYSMVVVTDEGAVVTDPINADAAAWIKTEVAKLTDKPCLLYTSPSPRDKRQSRMPSSA